MPVYEVKSVGDEPRSWSSSHGGNFLSYRVDLESEGKVAKGVEWTKKDTSPAPTVGEKVAGILEDGKYGEKFKIDYEATKELGGGIRGASEARTGSAGSQNAGGKGGWQPESERDPERSARILRQHSQGLAVQVLGAMGSLESKDGPTLHRWIKDWADFFDKDVNAVGEAAKQAPGNTTPGGTESAATSPASASSAPASQPADPSLTEIEQALDAAGLVGPARSQVASYMLSQLEPERQVNAIRKLTGSDLEAQTSALDSLKTLTEKWSGKPLPEPDTADGSDLPF